MNQSKFSLADLLTVLGTLGFGFFCYLSINFYTLGDTVTSLALAAFISFLLGGLAFAIKLLKRTDRNFKSSIIAEWSILFLYIIISIIALFPFSHFFYITTQKEIIQEKIVSNIKNTEGIFSEYENYGKQRLLIYSAQLKSAVETKQTDDQDYKKFGFEPGTNDDLQIKNKIFSLKAQLYPSNYEVMKQVNLKWLTDSQQNVMNWSPLAIVKIVNTLQDEIPNWRQQFVSYSSYKTKGDDYPLFDFKLVNADFSSDFTQKNNPTFSSFLLAIAFYILMLIPYLIEKRHTRFPGFKIIFRTKIKMGNEL